MDYNTQAAAGAAQESMTIVELLDNIPINNVVGALTFRPQKVIYVGSNSSKQFQKKKYPLLRSFFDRKGLADTAIEFAQVRRDDLQDIVEKFEKIYAENQNCHFNIEVTGGEDLTLIALGILCRQHPSIKLFQISSKLRSIRSYCLESAEKLAKREVNFYNTVEENLLLHGAAVLHANERDDTMPEGWVLDEEFLGDVDTMWDICCNGVSGVGVTGRNSFPRLWNHVTGTLAGFDADFDTREDLNTIRILERYYVEQTRKTCGEELADQYLSELDKQGLVEFYVDEGYVVIGFRNDQVRKCLTKAGTLLELKTYCICRRLLARRQGDCLCSVTVDWDGAGKGSGLISCSEKVQSAIANTVNEVDVMATCGLVPYFISCKNGKIPTDELYKLHSVGERFGAGYSRKIIVAADLQHGLGDSREFFLQRAEDMEIRVIADVHKMNDEQFCDALERAMELPD